MVMNKYKLLCSKTACKDREKLKNAGLYNLSKRILELMQENPFCYPPPYEKLVGDLNGFYSRRINRQHRIVYKVDEKTKTIYVYRMWTHYEK